MSELIGKNRKEALKEILRRLDWGESPAELVEEFKDILGGVSPAEIAIVEQELVKEGLPRERIRELCEGGAHPRRLG